MDELRAFLAAIVESSDDAIIGLNPQGRIFSWNLGAQQIYGYRSEEVIGQSISLISLPERSDEIHRLLARLKSDSPVRHNNSIHLHKKGHCIYVSLSVSPVIDRPGKLLGASVIVRDNTRQLKAEEALQEAEEKYRQLFYAEQDAIILFEKESGRIHDLNESALQLYGYPRNEFLQLRISELIVEGSGSQLSRQRSTARHRRSNGQQFAAEISVGNLRLKGCDMQVMIVRDISDKRQHQLLRQSLALAKEFQQRLLPAQTPQLPGYDIFVQSHYCQEAGGDYYDFFPLPKENAQDLAFAVGDVSGHNVGAALLMSLTKGVLQTEARHSLMKPDRLLQVLNDHLLNSATDSSFLTLFFGRIDNKKKQLHWNSAGHGPVFCYCRHENKIIELAPNDIPLGIAAKANYYNPPPLQLHPGDILLIGTDGLWETQNLRGELFRCARLRQILASHRDKDAASLYQIIMQKINDFRATPTAEDDMTLMVIKLAEA
ncbi:PAS domain S-box-containing protein [Malonomonas rubra DSM 5091]|uniref:PAS domain S-box-containing protein n=1 Tax=Malonomonas rubra DSM 5091 TaxID=1122189 RepID=A0A1M6ILM7_MALRU|nr:SpoIIE family protein phosphatase [Malonomonas rubra]SHJ35371.1 PAS domain S-box-containing protein [Malonomonas rubra DSM 5091]